ncbi:MAG: type IV secretory system conjugative DNA transfer family protein, partial [Actinomycetota bacterium]|nr:type IV secretory system conjugative DNA transfer family protein [Actinomycetota bacterium]
PTAARGAAWAGRRAVGHLAVPRPGSGRIVLGRAGRRLVAVERGQSLLVVGPTQSGKTSGLAIPALLEWEGPVLATSVKTDLVRAAYRRRAELGEVFVFDPSGVSELGGAGWSPLAAAASWEGARRTAAGLCGVARGSGGLEDGAFWYACAEKLLAPLLFAAASSGGTIEDVVRWVDTGEASEVLVALELAGVPEAVRAAEASFGREERQRSSVYTTAETVLAAFADPLVARACGRHDLDPCRLLGGGCDSMFLVAPAHEQERLQSVFVAIVRSVLEEAMTRSSRAGGPLDPPLLVVLDEAANVAPLSTLDTLASTAASHGIQLVTVWQDLAQVEARYAGRAATVVNNHRAKLLCSGISDAATLEQVGRIVGDETHEVVSSTVDRSGAWSRTSSTATRRLVPAEVLRCLAPGDAVLVYGHLPPLRIALRPVASDRALARLSRGRKLEAPRPAATGRRAGRGGRRLPRLRPWRRGRPSGRASGAT